MKRILFVFIAFAFSTILFSQNKKIDRKSVVQRHTIVLIGQTHQSVVRKKALLAIGQSKE